MMISIGKITFIARGMPSGMHEKVGSVPCPPSDWSFRFSSKIFWYSGVNSTCCAARGGLVWSNWLPIPGGRFHWPPKFGYFASSHACALIGTHRPTATVSAPIKYAAHENTPDRLRSIIRSSLADEWLAISLALHSVPRAVCFGAPRRHRRQAFFGFSPFSRGAKRELSVIAPAAQALECLSMPEGGSVSPGPVRAPVADQE